MKQIQEANEQADGQTDEREAHDIIRRAYNNINGLPVIKDMNDFLFIESYPLFLCAY